MIIGNILLLTFIKISFTQSQSPRIRNYNTYPEKNLLFNEKISPIDSKDTNFINNDLNHHENTDDRGKHYYEEYYLRRGEEKITSNDKKYEEFPKTNHDFPYTHENYIFHHPQNLVTDSYQTNDQYIKSNGNKNKENFISSEQSYKSNEYQEFVEAPITTTERYDPIYDNVDSFPSYETSPIPIKSTTAKTVPCSTCNMKTESKSNNVNTNNVNVVVSQDVSVNLATIKEKYKGKFLKDVPDVMIKATAKKPKILKGGNPCKSCNAKRTFISNKSVENTDFSDELNEYINQSLQLDIYNKLVLMYDVLSNEHKTSIKVNLYVLTF